jgi:hypothetical protein
MIDYSYLIRHASGAPTDPLTEWIDTFGKRSLQTAAKALERWRATHTLPWLVATLTLALEGDVRSAQEKLPVERVGEEGEVLVLTTAENPPFVP